MYATAYLYEIYTGAIPSGKGPTGEFLTIVLVLHSTYLEEENHISDFFQVLWAVPPPPFQLFSFSLVSSAPPSLENNPTLKGGGAVGGFRQEKVFGAGATARPGEDIITRIAYWRASLGREKVFIMSTLEQ